VTRASAYLHRLGTVPNVPNVPTTEPPLRVPVTVAAMVATARAEVVEAFADTALARGGRRSLEEVCEHLGIDVANVRARSQQLRRDR
jgi:hypothetical protein